MASSKAKKVTAAHVEDMKTREEFDHELALAIVRLDHEKRRILMSNVLADELVNAIRADIDGHFSRFVAEGGRKVPRAIYARKPIRRRRPFSPRADLEKLLRRFLPRCFTELHQRALDKAQLGRVVRRAHILIVEVVRRSPGLVPLT